MLEVLEAKGFEVEFHSHARAILQVDFPDVASELVSVLRSMTIPIQEIIGSGGGETKGTQRLRRSLAAHHWEKVCFKIEKTINGVPRESISHEVDHVRAYELEGRSAMIALEIEWNNKDPFFDRDLENFKRLHAEGAISLGMIVTRGSSLQNELKALVTRFVDENDIGSFEDLENHGVVPTPKQKNAVLARVGRTKNPVSFREAWVDNFVSNKFGAATTHWRKLADRIHRGVGNPCPLLLVGLPASIVTFDEAWQSSDAEDDVTE